ncbi:4-hydroxy-tetrahydrodipicolinate synthase [Pelagicoccus sp. SDUM812003]|uniref:4-hydroxy-tetrahydrodipicolinate synthase n=1 Tax=Pelagicoccus sp. SDUM812003 TaxID=3041267 RepID=UPI00280FD2B8|nr:4-hydroxy-tetrahydrodipicolinate synthase [Pelagicoccus sp. SDUM812003]MDQ8205079.1 4-hydroxy-tetrahydrodipicolinate synthase [Pelagicoccus sp. SDUM812003]
MSVTKYTGSITAMATPFLANGSLAEADLKKLVDAQIQAGIDALVPVGTTGECPTLNHDEHQRVVELTIETAAGRVPVIAGAGSNSTREAVSLTKFAHKAGAAAVLQVAPYYNKPSQEGLFRHFSAIAEATDRPVVLYSIPGRCGIQIEVETVERLLSKYPHVNHIKEAGGSVERVDELKKAMGDDLVVLSGDDSLTLPFICSGAEGVISVASNVIPEQVVALVKAARSGDLTTASKLHQKLYPLFKNLFIEPNPVPVKACMKQVGLLESSRVRLPLCEMTPENKQQVLSIFESLQSELSAQA